MIELETARSVLKKALSKGGEHAELFVERRTPTTVVLEDGKVEKILTGADSGAGIRLIFGGLKTAYAFTNDLSERALLEAAGTLASVAASGVAAGDMDLSRAEPGLRHDIVEPPDGVSIERKVHMMHEADRAARGYDKRVRQVSVIYRDFRQKVIITASDGTLAEDERVQTLSFVNVVAADGELVQTGYESVGGTVGFELFTESPLVEVALRAAGRAIRMLEAPRAPGGRMPVVISSQAGGTMIHEAIGHGLEADLVQQGLSVYSDSLGKEVASSLVTVVDSARMPGKRGSFGFDDEGTPSGENVLVKDGVLMGYMYDRLTAMKDSVRSTGNGRRESYRQRPIPRMTNTYIAPGRSSPDECLSSTPEGLLVIKMGGGQVNTVTGDFVFDVQEGRLIRDGSPGDYVRGATLTGNGPQVLRSMDMVCTDLGFSIGTCGKDAQGVPVADAMPTVRVPEMVVGGEV